MATKTYYRIDHATAASEVGVWPQLGGPHAMSPSRRMAFTKLLAYDHLPVRIPRLDRLAVESGAKFTDVLSCRYLPIYLGLIGNARFFESLANMEVCEAQTAPVSIRKGRKLDGFTFMFLAPSYAAISWTKSTFMESSPAGTKVLGMHRFSTAEDFIENNFEILSDSGNDLEPASIQLEGPLDFFRLPADFRSLHVSQELAEKIGDAKISGVTLEPSNVKFTHV